MLHRVAILQRWEMEHQSVVLFLRLILKLFELCVKVVGHVSRNLTNIWIFRSSINWLIIKKISPCFAKHCQNNLVGVKMLKN